MGKGGVVLGLIGIILAAGSVGFAFFVWNSQNSIQSELDELSPTSQDIWYSYYRDTFDVDLINTYMEITNMSLSINLTIQKSIKFSFTCGAIITGSSGRSDITVYFSIDGSVISYPSARIGGYNAGVGSADFHSVSLNHVIEGWSVGTHNITMYARSTVDVNLLQHCRLIVESY